MRERFVITLDSFEQRLLVSCLNTFRNQLLNTKGPTEDVDALIVKVIDAPMKKKGLVCREAR